MPVNPTKKINLCLFFIAQPEQKKRNRLSSEEILRLTSLNYMTSYLAWQADV